MGKYKKNTGGVDDCVNSTHVGAIFNTDKLDLRDLAKNGFFYSAKQKKIILDKLKIRYDSADKVNFAYILQDKLKVAIFNKYMLDSGLIFDNVLFDSGGIFFQKEQECLDELSVISFQKIYALERELSAINIDSDESEQKINYLKTITSEYLRLHYKKLGEVNPPKQIIGDLNKKIGFGLKFTVCYELEVPRKLDVPDDEFINNFPFHL